MIGPEDLNKLLPDFLRRQRWFGAVDRRIAGVEVTAFEVHGEQWPVLIWALAEVTFDDDDVAPATYQVPVGLRPLVATERFLEGKGRGMLGDVDTDDGPALVYDALVDPELARRFLSLVAPGEEAQLVRPLNVEQSNTSVVYDERLILKVFRRAADGPNPDVEMTSALARVGFEHISAPVAEWRRDGRDLAVLRTYLQGATDGFHLAQASLRDLYDSRLDPDQSGGDFAPEANRLGEITGQMHGALAEAVGTQPGDVSAWVDDMVSHLARVDLGDLSAAARQRYERLTEIADPGRAIRVHGDLHLGQMMRADSGWYVLDFEGEPARPLAERRRPSTPLKDVAGMLRSFHYAAQFGLLERGECMDDELAGLARRWEDRACEAYLEGYLDVDDVEVLLPPDDADTLALLDAFVVDKAVYEVGYERAHRPEWVDIPMDALRRLLTS